MPKSTFGQLAQIALIQAQQASLEVELQLAKKSWDESQVTRDASGRFAKEGASDYNSGQRDSALPEERNPLKGIKNAGKKLKSFMAHATAPSAKKANQDFGRAFASYSDLLNKRMQDFMVAEGDRAIIDKLEAKRRPLEEKVSKQTDRALKQMIDYMSAQSDEDLEKGVAKAIADRMGIDKKTYAKLAKSKDPNVAKMFKEIEKLNTNYKKGRDILSEKHLQEVEAENRKAQGRHYSSADNMGYIVGELSVLSIQTEVATQRAVYYGKRAQARVL